jgi:phage gp46-like protein
MTDVLIQQTNNEGDIECVGGVVTLTGGFESAVYLSLFGGSSGYWGNLLETDPARKYDGETEQALNGVPATPANLRKIEQAAQRDLSWLITTKAANTVSVSASMPGVNKITFSILISAVGLESQFEFTENWKWQ